VTTEQLLDEILIPRPNGSEGLERVGSFIAHSLEQSGAVVSFHEFSATPHGLQLAWTGALLLVLGYVASIALRRCGLALALMLTAALLLLLEFEFQHSLVSALLTVTERNVVGTFPGQSGGPTLIFCAHYDTITHFGDHFSWGAWGFSQGPASAAAISLAILGLWRRRRGRDLPRTLTVPVAALCALPFAAMFWFHAVGPLVRAPSPGAVDNGGSTAALLRFAEEIGARPAGAATTVKLVFLAAEEERTLGSRAYARSLDPSTPVAIVNLESVGASNDLAYIPEDGFALRRYRSSDAMVGFVNETAQELWGAALVPRELPPRTLTDGRSFLALGMPAITLRAFTGEGFPRKLHSINDSRDRLSVPAIDRSTELFRALVARSDADPTLIEELPGATGSRR